MHEPAANDPTRIPRLLDALRSVWEGQPDLTFGNLMGMLGNHGVSWGTTDGEVEDILVAIRAVRPDSVPLVEGRAEGLWRIAVGQRRIVLAADYVVVQGADARDQPVVWPYSRLRPIGPARPLVIVDSEGFEHRLGVADSVVALDASSAPRWDGLRHSRAGLGDHVLVVALEDDTTVVVGRTLRRYERGRRALHSSEDKWDRLTNVVVGKPFRASLSNGADIELAAVRAMWLADAPEAQVKLPN